MVGETIGVVGWRGRLEVSIKGVVGGIERSERPDVDLAASPLERVVRVGVLVRVRV